MISRHSQREGVTVRTTGDVRDAANTALEEAGWTMSDFLTACLVAVAVRPVDLLRLLAAHRPPVKPRGRPRKATPPANT